jgi:tetratricopeptide (TPR) repeat protein
VEKQKLAEFMQRYGMSTNEEAEQILALRNNYAYSQLLQALTARVSLDHNWSNKDEILQQAAIHCTDRTVLKEIMTGAGPKATRSQGSGLEPMPVAKQDKSQRDFADEVFSDLEKLRNSKQAFESLLSSAGQAQNPTQKIETRILKPKRATKRDRIVEMAKKLGSQSDPVKEQPKSPKATGKKLPGPDPLIEAIKTTRKKIEPENEKTREQIEIINQFIKAKPVIVTNPAAPGVTEPDMSESIRSGEFSDHIVSETLVEILLKQGKKDKAIEVLKKLIWKFPQKKTYFAARIDELKK